MNDIKRYVQLIESYTDGTPPCNTELFESALISKIKKVFKGNGKSDDSTQLVNINRVYGMLGGWVEEDTDYSYFVNLRDDEDMQEFNNQITKLGFHRGENLPSIPKLKVKAVYYGKVEQEANSIKALNGGFYKHPPLTGAIIVLIDHEGYLHIYLKGITNTDTGEDYHKEFVLLKP